VQTLVLTIYLHSARAPDVLKRYSGAEPYMLTQASWARFISQFLVPAFALTAAIMALTLALVEV
jgi:hypothetical protein